MIIAYDILICHDIVTLAFTIIYVIYIYIILLWLLWLWYYYDITWWYSWDLSIRKKSQGKMLGMSPQFPCYSYYYQSLQSDLTTSSIKQLAPESPSFPSHLATFPTKVAMLYRYTCPQVFFQVLHLGSSKTTRKGNLLILMVSGFQRIQLLSENNEPFVYHAHLLLLSFWCNQFWDGDF